MQLFNLWQRLAMGLLVGGLGGYLLVAGPTRPYQACITVHFPGINQPLFKKLLQVLGSDEASQDALSLVTEPMANSASAELAREILSSRAATLFACQEAHVVLTAEEVEHFREHSLQVDLRPGAVLEVQVSDLRADSARLLCQGYLDYYDEFVKKDSITPAGRVRRSLEKRYANIRQQLRGLEKKVSQPQARPVQELADDLVGLSGAVRQELSQRRQQRQEMGLVVLERLRKVRGELSQGLAAEGEEGPPDSLTQTLASERSGKGQPYAHTDVPRPCDLVNRVRLERNYEDSSALHRMLLLQQGLLRTLEELEQVDYKVIDPLSVHRQAVGLAWLAPALGGALLGMLLGLLSMPAGRDRLAEDLLP